MGPTARKVGGRFTYADYLTWPSDERWEIIGGEAYAMTPAPTTRHQEVSGSIFALFRSYFKGKQCNVLYAPTDVVLDDSNVVQPDILVVCNGSKLTEANVQGAPDLVVEILSPSTGVKDKREKKALYERFGVREYMIVDPEHDMVERFVLSEGRYGAGDVIGWTETLPVAIFPELVLNLWEVLGKELPPEEGDALLGQ
ncbi:Uma2 family endonuclease [Geobacter sp. DSM 9736]|uniref:Uma2 family endonuclease n=1 Tax=Geobacter sp. DSM 9736 TaxID=1277350 RepID=UPI000B5094AD|nr:Uma2 family endonuclease [Geobacter sp. DSM 9736]SNB46501.1 Endonuclease, Uma2 family (restriction endonuclease fold) [Geobacter sp. DSM 9736]